MPPHEERKKALTNREKQLIFFLRQLEWGELRVRVESGQPVLIYEAIRTMKLVEEEMSKVIPKNVKTVSFRE